MVFNALCMIIAWSGQAKDVIWEDFHNHELTEEQLVKIIKNPNYETSPLTNAYKGLCETMMAEHVFMPTAKLRNFSNGKAKIEDAIRKWPDNSELRYIRLMVQLNCPGFLNYDDKIDEDLRYFCRNFMDEKASKTHRIAIIKNLLESDGHTDGQRKELEELKKKIEPNV